MKRTLSILLLITFITPLLVPAGAFAASQAQDTCQFATLHYHRPDADYTGWGLHIWGPASVSGVTWTSPFEPTGEDDYGLFWEVPMAEGADHLNYIIHRADDKDPGPDQVLKFAEVGCEIWVTQGKANQYTDPETAIESMVVVFTPPPTAGENTVIIHYNRIEGDYDGWGLHIWGPTAIEGITWTSPHQPIGQDEFGIYWIIEMQPEADHLNYIVHKGDQKDPGPDQALHFSSKGREIWLTEGSARQFTSPADAIKAREAAKAGDITNKAKAFWVSKTTIAWDVNLDPNADVSLYFDPEGKISLGENGIEDGQTIPLLFAGKSLRPEIGIKFPHIKGMQTFKILDEYHDLLPDILRGQVVIAAKDLDGSPQGATALQIPGVLDDLYVESAWEETLGVQFVGDIPHLKLWAPTAKSVKLLLYQDSTTTEVEEFPMKWDSSTGVWSITGEADWKGKFYQYDVEVFIRQQGTFVHNLVTDPYSFSLAANSTRSQVVDLNDPKLLPDGWAATAKPALSTFTDIVLYELHLRDFSAIDQSVPETERGTFMAFTNTESNGMAHLSGLAEAGVTHVHLLPTFDIATINENKDEWVNVDFDELRGHPPDSSKQQASVNTVRGKDPFNWGYDPFHYTVPEGSYSTDPDGTTRILEFRQMVQALNTVGLRVVMDVVYNHTNASGQTEKSVLDRIVPGYYHRLDLDGEVTNSTCCANTATEHDMMRKLMIDSVLTWATAYKVDGFRFDLMGHHMVKDMLALREALDRLTFETNGVDGEMIYVYGEGWEFGEVAGNARGLNATQINMAGSGIGTFNDRGRDAVRGGTPFSPKQDQGFATGMYFDPNETNTLTESEQLDALLIQKDQIRVTLAGNLADYQFIGANGTLITGADVRYGSSPSGYTISPEENIIYVSAHDNETLFDAIQYKTPGTAGLEDRVQVQGLSLSLVAFSQGVPFFHAGSELLRSKSMDRDSYDSTDWFNALDWTYNDNGWGHGLPLEDKNGAEWPLIQPLLANPKIAPSQTEIHQTEELFKQWVRIRSSSPLFRMQTHEQIQNQVFFHNTGPDQVPGLIVMSINDDLNTPVDLNNGVVFVFWNASPDEINWEWMDGKFDNLELHPLLIDPHNSKARYDPATQTFSLPARSVAVFVGDTPLIPSNQEDTSGVSEDVEPTPEPKIDSELTTMTVTETPKPTPEPEDNVKSDIQPEVMDSTSWAGYLIGGAVLIAISVGSWLWVKRKQ